MNKPVFEKMQYYSNLTQKYLNEYFKSEAKIPSKLLESVLYSLNAGGKRLRPSLLLGTFNVFSTNNIETAVPYAASIEMIHTYSLIHDDLPAMDNDDLRRGKPSNHLVFGEAGAILAGDALLNSAMENLLDDLKLDYNFNKLKAAMLIMKAAGPSGMIGGQVLDIEGPMDVGSVNKMHSMKTGALIEAAVVAGAILGGCSETEEKALYNYAYNLGSAFQIKDDILDVESTSEVMGKPTGSDSRNNKVTYTSLFGLQEAKALLENRISDSQNALSEVDKDISFLSSLAVYIGNRKD